MFVRRVPCISPNQRSGFSLVLGPAGKPKAGTHRRTIRSNDGSCEVRSALLNPVGMLDTSLQKCHWRAPCSGRIRRLILELLDALLPAKKLNGR